MAVRKKPVPGTGPAGFFVFLIFSAALALSCANLPSGHDPEYAPSLIPAFELAFETVRMNSPLVEKYFEAVSSGVPADGARKEIILRGEFFIEGKRFRVVYDLKNAVKDGRDTFRFAFVMEEAESGVTRNGELVWIPADDLAGVLLSFDDDHWEIWRNYFDTFDSFGARVTFFIQGSPASRGRDCASPAESLPDFCREALRRGHDLGYHGLNHRDLTRVSRGVFKSETMCAAEIFARIGIRFSAFAFPFGFSKPWMREALARVFPVTRGYNVVVRYYNTKTIRNGYVVSKAIDNAVYPDDGKFEEELRLLLLAAKFSGGAVVPLTSHDIGDNAQYGIKPKRLEFLLETAWKLKLKFYTYADIGS